MKFVLIALLVAVAVGAEEEASSTESYVKDYPATPVPVTTATPDAYRSSYSEKVQPPMPYKFAWAVKDEPSKNDYSHQQESDGSVVTGSYRVLLPDGRTQIVTYTADANGYRAQVTYEGEAQYPAYKPAANTAVYSSSTPESYPPSASPLPVPSTSETYPTTYPPATSETVAKQDGEY